MTRFNLFAALVSGAVCLSSAAPVWAQATQPPPPAVPVPDVDEATLAGGAGQTIEGTARVVDGDEIVVGDKLVKLYGIAAPDITANLGPDARVALDALVNGQRVTCQAFDRDKNGNAIAQCKLGSTDLAEEMLAQGMAAVYRVSMNPTPAERELAATYDAAEADAHGGKVGVWADKVPVAKAPEPEAMPESSKFPAPDIGGLAGQLGGALLIGAAILMAATALRKAKQRDQWAATEAVAQDARILAAILSSEILAIQASADEQYQQTASLIQDLPIPGGQLALIGLPPAKVYNANADRLHTLPREVGVDLVQFYALHANVSRLITQASSLRAETLRAALKHVAEAAAQPMKQAAKVLD